MNSKKKKKNQPVSPEASAAVTVSGRYRFFRWLCVFFFVAALFIRLDVITVWPGAEGWALDHSLSSARADYLPAFLHGWLATYGDRLFSGVDLFFLFPRILSAILLLGAFWLYYRWGSRLFGKSATELHLMVAAGSLWLPFFGKMATADTWAFAGHVGLWLSTLLLLRSPEKKYQFIQGFFALFSAVAAPFSTVVLLLVLYLVSWWRQGTFPWAKALAAPLIAVVVAALNGSPDHALYYFLGGGGGGYGSLVGYAVLGLLPAIGFLLGGLRDLIYKLGKREDLALTMGTILLASLAAQSLLFGFVLAAIAGKQLQLFFTDRYPWNNWVKGPAILHLIFAFMAALFGLFSGLIQFDLEGYRAVLGTAAAYWIFSLLAVLGLYGNRRDFTLGGTVFTGLLAVLFFWVQVYPYLELERDWPEELLERADFIEAMVPTSTAGPDEAYLYVPDSAHFSNALPYFRRADIPVTSRPDEAQYQLFHFPNDSSSITTELTVKGRIVFDKGYFGVGE